MTFIQADSLSLFAFIALYICINGISLYAIKNITGHHKWVLAYGILTTLFSMCALTGLTLRAPIPTAPILLFLSITFCILFSFSSVGKRLIDNNDYSQLIGFQSFRFTLELILHHWFTIGTIPETMTWTGQNIDIIAGITCLLAIPFANRFIVIRWGAQLIGFILLMNVIRVALMSSPFPFSWPLEQPLLLVMYMPYALIVPGFVSLALVGHLLVFRKLLTK